MSAASSFCGRRVTAWTLLILLPAGALVAQEPSGAFEPVQLPEDDAQLEQRVAEIEAEILKLETGVQAATSQPGEAEAARITAASELLDALKTKLALLKDHAALRGQARGVDTPEFTARLEKEIRELQTRLDYLTYEMGQPPPEATPEALRRVSAEWEQASAELGALQAEQEQRGRRLASAGTDREAAAAEVQRTQSVLFEVAAQHEARLSAAASEAERARESLRLRAAQVAASTALLRAERLELESIRDARLSPHAERKLTIQRQIVEQLGRKRDRVKEALAGGMIEEVRRNIEYGRAHPDAVTPYYRAHWSLALEMVTGYEELTAAMAKSGLRELYPAEEFEALTRELEEEQAGWKRFMESLERRPGAQIKDRYHQIGRRLGEWQQRRAALQALTERAYAERSRIEARLDEIQDSAHQRLAEIRRIPSPSPAAAEQDDALRQNLVINQQRFDRELQEIRDRMDRLGARLDGATQALNSHVEALSTTRSSLYWSYIAVRDQPLWRYSPRQSVAEWNSDSERALRQADWSAMREGYDSVRPVQATVIAGLCIGALCLAVAMRLKLLRHADAWEERVGRELKESGAAVAPLSDRVHFQGVRFLARTAVPVWPCLVAWLCVLWTPLDGRFLGTGLLLLIGAGIYFAIIRTVFPRSKMRFRLLPCSNAVAVYYRRWMFVFFWIGLILAPVPLYLTMLHWAPYSRSFLWSVLKVVVTIALLIFALDKQTVLKVGGRPETLTQRTGLLLISALYPLMLLSLVGVLVLEVAGYRALTTYIFAGVAQSVAIALVAIVLLKYLRDVGARIRRQAVESALRRARDSEEAPRTEALPGSSAPAPVVAEASREGAESAGAVLSLGVLVSVVRWGLAGVAALLILRAWGLSWVELRSWMQRDILAATDSRPAITVGRAVLALVIVALSWAASRSIRSVLDTQVFPAYSQLDRGGRVAIRTLLHYFIVLFGLYFALATLRIPLGALTVLLGTIGLGVGLGLQPLVLNFLSGLVMLVERHLRVGDLVEVDGQMGEVTEIRMRATSIRTVDGADVVVPNADFINRKVVNWTLKDTLLRGQLNVGVAYGTDPRLVEKLLLAIATQDPLVLSDPPPRVRFMNFGDNSLDFALYVWFKSAGDRFDFLTDSRYRIVEAFKAHGVEIPFPQRSVSLESGHPIRVLLEGNNEPADGDGAPAGREVNESARPGQTGAEPTKGPPRKGSAAPSESYRA